jgi:predicted ATPase
VELGRCEEALRHLDEAAALYAKYGNHRHSIFIGRDCKVVVQCFAARALWALGYPDQAAEKMDDAVRLARDLGHPQSLVIALHVAAQLYILRREARPAYECAKEVMDLADEYGLELWMAYGEMNMGWAVAELGDLPEGIERMRRGLAAYERTGAKLWRPYFLGLLATLESRTGQFGNALKTLDEALRLAERGDEMYSLPELYRIRAQILIECEKSGLGAVVAVATDASPVDWSEWSASDCLTHSLHVARQHKARFGELRALATLASCDSRFETRESLRKMYAWFTEGHDTPDLQHVRLILEEAA